MQPAIVAAISSTNTTTRTIHAADLPYVLNLTRIWRPDWGGTLHFMEQDGRVTETVTPKFNTLTLFTVPALHYVAPVAPYAIAERYSITGWLHSGSRPNP